MGNKPVKRTPKATRNRRPTQVPDSFFNRERRQSISAEGFQPDETDVDEEPPRVVYPKTDDQRKRLKEAVTNILMFRNLDAELMQEVFEAMFERRVKPGEHVIDQGDDGDNFYVIDRGSFDILVKEGGKQKLVGSYVNKGSFGELALMYNMPRQATIVAKTDGSLWALDRNTFRRIVLNSAYQKRQAYEKFLESVPMLKYLSPEERMSLADALFPKICQDGERIIKEGDQPDFMYFVEEGEVVIKVKDKQNPGSGREVEVNVIKTGQYFGELALVTNKPRAASAYARGRVKLAALEVHAFERLLGPCMDIMKRNINEYDKQLRAVFGQAGRHG